MFLVWIVIQTVVTSISTLIFAFAAGLEGLSVNLFAGIFAQLPYANFLLFLKFSPFVFISVLIINMFSVMMGGAGLSLVNLMGYGQNWAPFVPWISPYLIASGGGGITEYATRISVSYSIILVTFVIGLTISYIYFTRTDVSL